VAFSRRQAVVLQDVVATAIPEAARHIAGVDRLVVLMDIAPPINHLGPQ